MDRRSYTGSGGRGRTPGCDRARARALWAFSFRTAPSPQRGEGNRNPRPRRGRGKGEGELDLAQQAAVAGDALAHAGEAQRLPEARLVAADYRLAEIALQRLQHGHGGQPRATQKHRVGLGRVGLAGELIRALLVLRVDVRHVLEAVIAGD